MESRPRPHSARPYTATSLCGDLDSVMVQMMLAEIQTQIDRLENESETKRKEALKATNSPDYSWLMDWKIKNKKSINSRESQCVELLCKKIKPHEWSQLHSQFRSRVRYIASREEVIDLFRTIVQEFESKRLNAAHRATMIDELSQSSGEGENWPRAQVEGPRSLSVANLVAPESHQSFNEPFNVV